MKHIKDLNSISKIPESLTRQISAYSGSLLKGKFIILLGLTLITIFLSFFSIFISDRFCETPLVVRFLSITIGVAAGLFFIIKIILNYFYNRPTLKMIAKDMQKNHKELGDRLLGAIELAEDNDKNEFVSEELTIAAIKKISDKTSNIDFQKDIDKKSPIKASILALIFAIIGVLLFLIYPLAFNNSFNRWIKPLKAIKRFTFVTFEEHINYKYIPMGEPFTVEFEISPNSKWIPKSLSYYIKNITQGSLSIVDRKATIKLNGLNKKKKIIVFAGDQKDQLELQPIHRPSLISLNAIIKYPKYLSKKDKKIEIPNGKLALLLGAKVKFKGKISRKLKSASVAIRTKSKENKDKYLLSECLIKDQEFTTQQFADLNDCKLSYQWIDTLNFTPQAPYDINLKILKDQPPISSCPKLPLFSAILIDESMDILIKSKDDFGIKDIGIEYSYIINDNKKIKKVNSISKLNHSTALQKENKGSNIDKFRKEISRQVLFSPNLEKIPEQTLVTIRSFSLDYYPKRELQYSTPHQIYILNHEQHIKLLQERLEEIMRNVEEMIRREEESLDETIKISKLSAKELKSQKVANAIKEQKEDEKAEKREAEDIVKKGINLLKEALRNKKFPKKDISKWGNSFKKLKDISRDNMEKTIQSLTKASDKNQREKGLLKAIKEEKTTIDKLKKTLKEMDDSLKSISLDTFVNRLKREAKNEEIITNNFKGMIKDIIGLSPKEIGYQLREKFNNQIINQNKINKKVLSIKDDLRAFFERTKIKKYQFVTDDMEFFNLSTYVKELYENIKNNYTSQTISKSKNLSKKLNQWATILSDNDNKKAKQSDEKDQDKDKISMEFLIGIMQLIQAEQSLREKTRYLNLNREDKKSYKYKTTQLAFIQGDIHLRMSFLMAMARKCPKLMKLLKYSETVMDEVVKNLRNSQTDSSVIATETEIIELLASIFKSANDQSKGAASNNMMSLLMQMMMQQYRTAGNQPGESSNGALSDIINKKISGSEFKKYEGSNSNIDKTEGSTNIALPEEYKNAIEIYFKKREEIEDF